MRPAQDAVLEWLVGLLPVVGGGSTRWMTVMFTDIRGFTRSAAAGGDSAAVRLLAAHDRAVLPPVRRHRGRIVKRLGDGLMAAFASPRDAVAAALAMQAAAARLRFGLRIGIHAGAARVRAGDLIGHDVNVAARVTDRAGGGEIVVSASVRRHAGEIGARFRSLRPLVVGDRARIPLFRVDGPAA